MSDFTLQGMRRLHLLTHTVWCLLSVLAVLVGGSGIARAAPPDDLSTSTHTATSAPPADWHGLAAEMVLWPEFAGLALRTLVSRGHAPVEMEIRAEGCVLHLRAHGHPVADLLLRQVAPDDRRLWMQAIVVHEIAHCWRWQGQGAALQQFAALIGTAGRDTRRLDEVHQRMRTEETFADVAALAWVWQVAPARFGAMLNAFERLRSHPALSAGTHDTRAALDRVRRQGFAAAPSPFEAARALLANQTSDTGR